MVGTKTERCVLWLSVVWGVLVLLLFAFPTSDRVVARTPLHLLYDFLYELLSSRLSYFSFPSLIRTTRSTQCRTTIFDAVMEYMMELVTLLQRITYVFGDEDFSRQVICASERTIPIFSSTSYSVSNPKFGCRCGSFVGIGSAETKNYFCFRRRMFVSTVHLCFGIYGEHCNGRPGFLRVFC